MLDYLILHAWSVHMPDGTFPTTFLGRPDQQLALLQIGRHMNPKKYGALYMAQATAMAATVVVPIRAIRDPEERLRELIVRHARIATRGQGAVTHLNDEIRALPPGLRKQIEEKMRLYFDLIRNILIELRAAGRLRDVHPTVATFSVLGMILWLPRWFRQDGGLTEEQVAEEIAKVALGGLIRRSRPKRAASPRR